MTESASNDPTSLNSKIQALEKRLARERKAREMSESLLEEKSRELFTANQALIAESEETKRTAEQLQQALDELKQTQAQLIQASKMESLGTLAGGIAHEINTPSQFVGDNLRFISESFEEVLQLLQAYEKGDSSEKTAEIADEIDIGYLREEIPLAAKQALEGAGRISEIVRAMKNFAHPDQAAPEEVDLNEVINSSAIISKNEWKHHASLDTDLSDNLPPLSGFAGQLSQLVLNLLVNAAHAIEETGRSDGKISIATKGTPDSIELTVSDNGRGIPKEIADQIFDPFFTTKKVGKGTGQGLTMCHDIVTAKHNGTIRFDSEPGQGTTFTITLPVSHI